MKSAPRTRTCRLAEIRRGVAVFELRDEHRAFVVARPRPTLIRTIRRRVCARLRFRPVECMAAALLVQAIRVARARRTCGRRRRRGHGEAHGVFGTIAIGDGGRITNGSAARKEAKPAPKTEDRESSEGGGSGVLGGGAVFAAVGMEEPAVGVVRRGRDGRGKGRADRAGRGRRNRGMVEAPARSTRASPRSIDGGRGARSPRSRRRRHRRRGADRGGESREPASGSSRAPRRRGTPRA